MAERLNAAVLKTVDRAIGPWVRIPLSPPFIVLTPICLVVSDYTVLSSLFQ